MISDLVSNLFQSDKFILDLILSRLSGKRGKRGKGENGENL